MKARERGEVEQTIVHDISASFCRAMNGKRNERKRDNIKKGKREKYLLIPGK
jgi:hypothetical protein